MKAKLVLVALLFIGSFSTEVLAQTNIEAVIKKSEGLSSVKTAVTRTKTNGRQTVIRSIHVKDDKTLVDEFIAAFRKDSDTANSAVENEDNGKLRTLVCKFGNTSYMCEFNHTNSEMLLHIIEKPN